MMTQQVRGWIMRKMDEIEDSDPAAIVPPFPELIAMCARERPDLFAAAPPVLKLVHSAPILASDDGMKPRRRRKRVAFRVIDGGRA